MRNWESVGFVGSILFRCALKLDLCSIPHLRLPSFLELPFIMLGSSYPEIRKSKRNTQLAYIWHRNESDQPSWKVFCPFPIHYTQAMCTLPTLVYTFPKNSELKTLCDPQEAMFYFPESYPWIGTYIIQAQGEGFSETKGPRIVGLKWGLL